MFKFKGKILSRHKAGEMNRTEQKYCFLLQQQLIDGEIKHYEFESIKLKIGSNCYYTPDFFVINSQDEIEFHEVKGFWMDDAKVKIKAVAHKFPFKFRAFYLKNKKWEEEDFTQY